MPVAPSFEELEQVGRAEALVHRPDLQFNTGDISEMLMKAAAAMADRCIEFSASSFKETFIDGAAGDALTQLVSDHWNINRQTAVAAVGEVTFTRGVAGPAGTIAAGTVVATAIDADGNEYRFTTDAGSSWALNETGSKVVAVTASAAGRSSNVASGTVTRIIDTLFDTFTVTNASPMAGGANEESDAALRERVRAYPSTLRRGTVEALEYGAKSVAGVSVAYVEEGATGLVTVYVSDVDGNSNVQMEQAVENELEEWRCAGTVVQVQGGEPRLENIEYSISVKTGVDVAALETLIADSITAIMDKMTLGEPLYRSRLLAAILNVDIDNITNAVIVTPADDIDSEYSSPLQPYELIRPGTITRV